MNVTNKPLRNGINFICNVILLAGCLTLLFPSCVIEIIPDITTSHITGQDGNLQFDLTFAQYGEEGDSETTTHSSAFESPESVVVQVGDDLFFYATLSENHKAETQPVTTRAFTQNAKILIVAYDSGTSTFKDSALYRVTSPTSLVRESSNLYMSLDPGTYTFVAYSYNTTDDPPPYSTSLTNIDPQNDLIWGVSSPVTLVQGVITPVPITMYHKLSLIKTVLTTGSGGPNITGISNVTMPGYNVNMVTETGAISNDTDTVQVIISSATPNSPIFTAADRTVFTGNPAANPTVLHIGSLSISGSPTPLNDVYVTFAKAFKSGYSYTLTIKIGESMEITDDPPPAGFTPYVGAFWRADQRGERLIRMPRVASGAADGVWTAQVIEGKDWIRLDTVMTADVNVGWRPGATESSVINGNDAVFESAQYWLNGNSTFVSGILGGVDGTSEIYFRIGLTANPFTPTTNVPARYGMILLTYANNTKRQRIWIRQGEGDDYLMRPQDYHGDGSTNWGSPDPRPDAQRISPYNLSIPSGGTWNSTVGYQGGRFTEYPTRPGAYWQWASSNNTNFAWAPTGSVSGWSPFYPSGYWTDATNLSATHETCPPGYRRPYDGITNADNAAGAVFGSEIRQSLFLKPKTGDTKDADTRENTVFGYYADGFFDRRQITTPTTGSSPMANSAVSVANNDIAYNGRLFFNPVTFASLFFPAQGSRDSGPLNNPGAWANYWTGSSINATQAWYMGFNSLTDAGMYTYGTTGLKSCGYAIRCVFDPPVSVNPSILIFAWNAVATQTVTVTMGTLSGWSVTNIPSWLNVSPTSGSGSGTFTVVPNSNNIAAIPRTDTLLVTVGTYSATVVVIQEVQTTLSVNPTGVSFDHTANGGGSKNVTVTTNNPSGWTAAKNGSESWYDITPTLGATGGTITVTINEANPSVSLRTATFTVSAGAATPVIVTVMQYGDFTLIPGAGTPTAFVGAFWRAGERGERVIRANHSGAWTASVSWYDDRWEPATGDGIVLASGGSGDGAIYSNTPGNAESFLVPGTATTISGTGQILFRIGLQMRFSDTGKYAFHATNAGLDANYTTTWPARYAVIVITHSSGQQKFFVRQGEGADFLMFSEPFNSGGVNHPGGSMRPAARRIAFSNLTSGSAGAVLLNVQGGILATYPTQAGSYFMYAASSSPNNYTRAAWPPHIVEYGNIVRYNVTGYWSTLAATHETCPAGYHRPHDGIINGPINSSSLVDSEIRQSLFLSPQVAPGQAGPAVTGYYADGFFDRRQIGNAPVYVSPVISNSTVSYFGDGVAGGQNIAYTGALFYNPYTNAAIFFPATGYRRYDTRLISAGLLGRYWTTGVSSSGGNYMQVHSNNYNSNMGISLLSDEELFSIRCVLNRY